MTKYQIESKAGVVFGTYEADTAEAAFAAMVSEAGDGVDTEGESTAGQSSDWIITEVE